MIRVTFLTMVMTVTVLTPALSQTITREERAACQTDYDKYCRGTFPGGGRIIRCLEKQYAQLSESCKKVVDAQKK